MQTRWRNEYRKEMALAAKRVKLARGRLKRNNCSFAAMRELRRALTNVTRASHRAQTPTEHRRAINMGQAAKRLLRQRASCPRWGEATYHAYDIIHTQ